MNYVEAFNLLGIEAKQIPCINGEGAPTTVTEGAVGCLYIDTVTNDIYKCTNAENSEYLWIRIDDSFDIVMNKGSNLLNIEELDYGCYYWTDGRHESTNYNSTHFIAVEPGQILWFQTGTDMRVNRKMYFVVAYDEYQTIIAASVQRDVMSYTVPAGAAFVVITSLSNLLKPETSPAIIVSEDGSPVEYTPYIETRSKRLKPECHNDSHIQGIVEKVILENDSDIEVIKDQVNTIEDRFEKVYTSNKFDISTATYGQLMAQDGKIHDHADYMYSDYIPVTEGEILTLQGSYGTVRNIRDMGYITAFDNEKNVLADLGNTPTVGITSYTVPAGVSFIILSATYTYYTDTALVASDKIIPYEPYFYLYLKDEYLNIDEIVDSKLSEEISISDLNFAEWQNLYNKNSEENQDGKFAWNGALSDNSSYFVTGFIRVKPNAPYAFYGSPYISTVRSVEQFDSSKELITGTSVANVSTITTVSSAKYIRACFYQNCKQTATIVEGTTPISNVEYECLIPSRYIKNSADEIDAYLPKDLYCAVGRTLELYNNQVCLQSEKYHMAWNCTIGKSLSRKFSVTGTENLIGNYTLTLSIYDDKLKVIWSGSTNLHIVSNILENNYSICPIGDSLTNMKAWLPEVINLSNNKISYIGSYTTNLKDADGNSHNIGHEGRSGFSAKNYIEGAIYSYGGETTSNIFWDGTRFSWSHYKTTAGIQSNCVQIFLGTNGISADNTENANYIKQMVDYIRQDDTNIPIFIVNTIYRSSQNGIGVQQSNDGYASAVGVFKYNEDKKVMDLMKRLDSLFAEGYSNVYMINLALTHDSEYNFGNVETPVNPRAQQTEFLPIESVHPQTQGYYQMADVIFSVYCAALD